MSDEQTTAPTFDKGDRAAIVAGKKNVGVRGQVFWIGDNKYGEGKRYGLRGDDGETYWVDGSNIGVEDGAPPAPDAPPPKPLIPKGSRVSITKGGSAGVEGEVFWSGENKYGPGNRYGIKDDEGETHWADSNQVEQLSAPAEGASEARSSSAPKAAAGSPPVDDAPLPDGEDDFAGGDDFADDFGSDVPFPGDDLPF